MRRKARVNFRSRVSLSRIQIRIRSQPVRDWPPYLLVAWEILTSELGLSDTKARSVILDSVLAARQCVTAQNELLSDIVRIRTQRRLRTACSRVPNCIKRGPAGLRQNLSWKILRLLEKTIDLEVLESILETARNTFEAFPDNEPYCAALNSLKGVDFAGIPTAAQDKALKAVEAFKTAKNTDRTTTQLFIAIGAAVKSENAGKTSTQISTIIVRYVAELAAIWRRAKLKQLKPSRARRYLDLNPTIYSSRFHQFAELILLAATGLRVGQSGKPPRHIGMPDVAIPQDIRPWIEASRMGEKYKWFVSDNHLKRALGDELQK
jgi:hypothetical protein